MISTKMFGSNMQRGRVNRIQLNGDKFTMTIECQGDALLEDFLEQAEASDSKHKCGT